MNSVIKKPLCSWKNISSLEICQLQLTTEYSLLSKGKRKYFQSFLLLLHTESTSKFPICIYCVYRVSHAWSYIQVKQVLKNRHKSLITKILDVIWAIQLPNKAQNLFSETMLSKMIINNIDCHYRGPQETVISHLWRIWSIPFPLRMGYVVGIFGLDEIRTTF